MSKVSICLRYRMVSVLHRPGLSIRSTSSLALARAYISGVLRGHLAFASFGQPWYFVDTEFYVIIFLPQSFSHTSFPVTTAFSPLCRVAIRLWQHQQLESFSSFTKWVLSYHTAYNPSTSYSGVSKQRSKTPVAARVSWELYASAKEKRLNANYIV